MDLSGLLNADGSFSFSIPEPYSNEAPTQPVDPVLQDVGDFDFWASYGTEFMAPESSSTHANSPNNGRPELVSSTTDSAFHNYSDVQEGTGDAVAGVDRQVCYGMLHHHIVQVAQQDMSTLIKKLTPDSLSQRIKTFAIDQSSDRIALQLADRSDFGHLRKHFIKAFEELRKKAPGVSLEAIGLTEDILEKINRATKSAEARCHVDINVYGPEYQSDVVGAVLMKHKLWLQRPDNYRVDEVTYLNPQAISFPGLKEQEAMQEQQALVESSPLASPPRSEEEVLGQVMSEVHGQLTRDRGLGMESGDQSITTELLPHQRRALKYMLERESGDIPVEFRLWKETFSGVSKLYIHRITGSRSYTEPSERGGGVLADEMGTGKSLSTLALITRTRVASRLWLQQKHDERVPTAKIERHAATTLVIVPSAQLIANWVNEIDCHTGTSLKSFKYHGTEREKNTEDLASYDVVITTYNTLASDYKKKKSILHKIGWYRIVLDEAHYIRNHSTIFYHACCELEAHSRWCLTGTPIQNRLEDIGSLFSFLRAAPFNSRAEFRRTICVPFESREISTARDRLVMLYDSLVLRRSKDTCITGLPDPVEELRQLEFTPEEAAQYARTLQVLERRLRNQAYFQHGSSATQYPTDSNIQASSRLDSNAFRETGLYQALADENASRFSLFHAMMQLRILCNHGTYQHMFSWKKQRQNFNAEDEHELLLGDTAVGAERVCDGCSHPMSFQSGLTKPNDFAEACPHALCLDCLNDSATDSSYGDSGKHCPICWKFRTSLKDASVAANRVGMGMGADTVMTDSGQDNGRIAEDAPYQFSHYFRQQGTSSKLNALMDDITHDSEGTKRQVKSHSIVFSCWTRTLDLIQARMRASNIEPLRIDGKSPLPERQRTIKRFEEDTSVQILLMTTGTGAHGLNLTAASRIFIFELQWNPSIERQAIARAIRIGQTRQVRVTRYLIRDTVEQSRTMSNVQLEGEAAHDDNYGPEDASSTNHDVFQNALDAFEIELSPVQIDEFSRTTVEHVKRKILSIQRDQERVKNMIGFSRMQLFLEKIGDLDALCVQAEIWKDKSSFLSAWIWGPALYILKVAKCLGFMYLDLLKFHQKVVKLLHGKWWRKTFDSRWRDYQGDLKATLVNFETHSEVLGILSEAWERQRTTEAFIRFDQQTRQFEGSTERIQQLIDRMPVFNNIDHRLNDMLAHMKDIRHNHGRNSSQDDETSLNAGLWKDIRKQLNDHVMRSVDDRDVLNLILSMFKGLRVNMTKQFSQWESERKSNQRTEVLKWMSSFGISQASQHDEFYLKVRAPNTGLWIRDNHKISSWINDENPTACLVWMNGQMGVGKTILASNIIQLCMGMVNGFNTHYFYCRKHHDKQNTSLAVLKSILEQMAGCNDELLPYCDNKRIEGRQEFLDQINVVKQLLEAFCEYDSNKFVIIDGLDECDQADRKTIIDFWKGMVDKTINYMPGKLRVLLISQDIPDIRAALKDSMISTTLDLHPDDTNGDIQQYLEGKAPELQERFGLDESQKHKALQLIYSRANGMFLYASMTVENLLQQPTRICYEDELLKNLPENLTDAYAQIIERLKSNLHRNGWAVARNILGWLASANRPLKWYELQAALSMQLTDRGINIDPRYRLRDDIQEFDLCGPLVRVIKEDGEQRLEFTHSTARSYIRSGIQNEGLNANAIDCDIAVKCLSYLSAGCFHPNLDETGREYYAQRGYYALQDYAVSEWGHHLQQLISHAAPLFEDRSREAAIATRQLSTALRRFLSFYREIESGPRDRSMSDIADGSLHVPRTFSSNSRNSPLGFSDSSPQPSGSFRDNESTPDLTYPSLSPGDFSVALSLEPSGSRSPDPASDPMGFCEAFRYVREVYDDLVRVWTHVRNHRMQLDAKEREKISLPQLRTMLELSRKTVQSLVSADPQLVAIYGDKPYKCDRVPCGFFSEGFATSEELEKHVNRHDRPFHCPVPNCSVAPFGFANKKDCERHVRTYHPEAAEDEVHAAFATGKTKASAEDIESRAKYSCTFQGCDKKYTRKANLDAHLDTHNGTRRFACRTCVKAFTRPSDRQRHEKGHMRGK
ncbi:SNF2 family N-terminal domain-containing protein [Apiospora kogelbergensis]|uniref:SNF2 family N-terminal domain-containing protein n=1 Tax=Apiospora kogelbergensis TaxID=1337665 RepID=A0AAW0QQE9_9PEZI